MPFWNPLIGGSKALEIEITANTTNYNIKTEADTAAGGDSAGYPKITLTIPSTVIVGSPSPGTYALDVGAFNPDQDIEIINNGAVVGRGGNGGPGAPASGGQNAGPSGDTGGKAMKAPGSAKSVTFINNGILSGGGGGGAGGVKYNIPGGQSPINPKTGPSQLALPPIFFSGAGGSGGAGYPVGNAGPNPPGPRQGVQPGKITGTGPYNFYYGHDPANPGFVPPVGLQGLGGALGLPGGPSYAVPGTGPPPAPSLPGPGSNFGGVAGPYLDGTQYVTIQGNVGQGPSQTT